MPLPFTPILIAGATAAIGWFFQENSARNLRLRKNADTKAERERKFREAELEQAHAIFHELTSAMDVLYYMLEGAAINIAVRKATNDTTRETKDEATWEKVDNAITNWMSHKTRFTTQVREYFGESSNEDLKKIDQAFDDAWSIAESTYYNGRRSIVVPNPKKPDYSKYYAIVGSSKSRTRKLEGQIIRLNEQMIRDIQTQQVGKLRTN